MVNLEKKLLLRRAKTIENYDTCAGLPPHQPRKTVRLESGELSEAPMAKTPSPEPVGKVEGKDKIKPSTPTSHRT